MNAKHTPGPWVATETGYILTKDGTKRIAKATSPNAYEKARLIAAAPDLLEALIRLIDNPGPRKMDDEMTAHKKLGAHIETVSAARAAIAKATGNQS